MLSLPESADVKQDPAGNGTRCTPRHVIHSDRDFVLGRSLHPTHEKSLSAHDELDYAQPYGIRNPPA